MDQRPSDSQQMKLAVIEVLDRDGHARLVVPVWQWPVRVGRAIDCDVVLDDAHVAAHHATLAESDGVLTVDVGDTVNGVRIGPRLMAAQQRAELPSGATFEIGGTRLRVRLASATVPPERLLTPEPPGSRVPLVALLVALVAWKVGEQWLNTDPGGRVMDYLPVLLGPPLALAVWCGFWSLGSRLFRHRFDYWAHMRVALTYQLALAATALMLPLLAFALGWTFLSRIAGIVAAGVMWGMVLAHLTLILPSRRQLVRATMGAMFAAGVTVFLVWNYQRNDRIFPELYVSTLAPPVLRLAPTVETTRFIEEARGLKAVLDAHTKDDDNAGDDWPDE